MCKLCFLIGHSQECQDVVNGINFYIRPNTSYCLNCPYMSGLWMINNDFVSNAVSASEYTVFSNNSLLMRRSVEGPYQCGEFPTIHQFQVVLASKLNRY